MFKNFLNTYNTKKDLKKIKLIADKIVALENEMQKLSNEELKLKTDFFREELKKGKTLDDILVESFAVAREATYRVLNQKPFYVQILGAISLHKGDIAEMKTGEGKTLTSILPAYLNALEKKGVHIVTVNEYLAKRDSEEMGKVHKFLNISVGLNSENLTTDEKREAYNCDITYTTNSEIGFDYLRDNMVIYKKEKVQRGLNFAIIDEADSILIDESKTPLIIGGGDSISIPLYISADKFVKSMKKDKDYEIELSSKSITLTNDGIKKAEKFFNTKNIFSIENTALVHKIMQALKANYIFHKNIDYLVRNNTVFIIDQFTGRILEGRRYSDGLHQAIECKEKVQIKEETKVLATTTYQNFFRLYNKLSGMTGTAKTEEEEFLQTYNMRVTVIPTNKEMIRKDHRDVIYGTLESKYKSLINEIEKRYKKKQPVLVGTVSVESSEIISKLLKKRNIKHNVLNAKYHEKEAEIIAKAGEKGSITIATNMAGRGTDIKLGKGVKELGGLVVLGSERHESRRIDNQLRGRAGRQGDPGESRFYLSFQDDLMKRFGNEKLIQRLMGNLLGDEPLHSEIFSRQIESAQKQIEGINYDLRKNTLQYDDILRIQRQNIYEQRDTILDTKSIDCLINKMINFTSERIVKNLYKFKITKKNKIKKYTELINTLNKDFNLKIKLTDDEIKKYNERKLIKLINKNISESYQSKHSQIDQEIFDRFQKSVSLNILDRYWTEHIDIMNRLRNSIYLRGYAQRNPLYAYQEEAYEIYNDMLYNRDYDILQYIIKSQILDNLDRKKVTETNNLKDSYTKVKLK